MKNEETKTGGPIFPCEWEFVSQTKDGTGGFKEQFKSPGLTRRDYFAGIYLKAIVAARQNPYEGKGFEMQEAIAEEVWAMADAMLKKQ